MRQGAWFALAAAVAGGISAASAQHQHSAPPPCAGVDLACATAATPAFAGDGSLWLAWSAGGQVMVARSGDLGHSFASPVAINPKAAKIDNGPDARAKIAPQQHEPAEHRTKNREHHHVANALVSMRSAKHQR